MSSLSKNVIVIGGGLSGLSAALCLNKNKIAVTLIEKQDQLGGRVQSSTQDGFILDKGFQVLNTSYSEIRRLKIAQELELKAFDSGAECFIEGAFRKIYNPLAHPHLFIKNWHSFPKKYIFDFIKLSKGQLAKKAELSTKDYFNKLRLSSSFEEDFLKPFFSGVFLEGELKTKANLFQSYLYSFIFGKTTLPKNGMQALPNKLAEQLTQTEIKLESQVVEIKDKKVILTSGETIEADAIILAVDEPALSNFFPDLRLRKSLGVQTCFFALKKGLFNQQKLIYLNGQSPLSNFCFLNHIQPSYAPKDFDLLCANALCNSSTPLIDAADAQREVAKQLKIEPKHLQLIKEVIVHHALPFQEKQTKQELDKEGIYLASERSGNASINGALQSGYRAAKRLLKSFSL